MCIKLLRKFVEKISTCLQDENSKIAMFEVRKKEIMGLVQ